MQSHDVAAHQPQIQAIRAELEHARAQSIARYREDLQATRLLRHLCRHADVALRALLKVYPLPTGAALAAVGGYGRAELYPYSDVDLLILLAQAPNSEQTQQIEKLIAALWDLGIEPGCSVRTMEEALLYAREDITIETALLEIRHVAGQRKLVQSFETALNQQLDAREFFRSKLAEMQQRHARFANTPYALEPNCKESPGGLRDLQIIHWLARAAGFGKNWTQIARSGMLRPQEVRDLRRAQNAFTRLRVELHLMAKRREDRLVFDFQHRLASIYGIESSSTHRASEILMQRYYWAARLVTQLNTVLIESLRDHLFPVARQQAIPIDPYFLNLQGRLDIAHDNVFQDDPRQLLRAFLVIQQNPAIHGMTARTLRAIWHARVLIDAAFRRDPFNRQTFLQILKEPEGIVRTLRRMTMLNILPKYLPVFRRIVGQMQHDLFHAYTVDQHTLLVIRHLRRFTQIEHAQEFPLCSGIMAGFDRHWILYVAALFHDIAKGRGGDHSELGAQDVQRFAKDHGLQADETDLVVFLVEQHLLMSRVAQKQDLSDPQVIAKFADQVGSIRRLNALYLLTVADIRATGPKIWNAWKGKLLEDLYHQARRTLGSTTTDHTKTALQERIEEASTQIREFGLTTAQREMVWNTLDVAYFLRHETSDIAWHTQQLHSHVHSDQPIVRARPFMVEDSLQVMVYTPDREDLFASICAFFWAHALDVLDARIHTTREAYALDTFIVLFAQTQIDPNILASNLATSLTQHLSAPNPQNLPKVSTVSPLSRMSRAFPIEPKVELQPAVGADEWRLAIMATDRPGLLAQLAQVFVAFKVNVISAKVMTLGERVEDIFMIHAPQLASERILRQFERTIYSQLANASLSH